MIAYHVRQSFRPGEITPEEANRLGVEFSKRFTKGNHAFVVDVYKRQRIRRTAFPVWRSVEIC